MSRSGKNQEFLQYPMKTANGSDRITDVPLVCRRAVNVSVPERPLSQPACVC
jgi:hypothetical protein